MTGTNETREHLQVTLQEYELEILFLNAQIRDAFKLAITSSNLLTILNGSMRDKIEPKII